MNSSPAILYKAPWVVPVATPVIRDGGVLVRGGRIEEVAPYSQLTRQADRIVAIDGALMPQLVNCHAHLELSVYGERFKKLLRSAPPKTFPDWIEALLGMREEEGGSEAAVAAARTLQQDMADEGVGLVVDTGNLPASAALGEDGPIEVIFLLEMLGLTEQAAGDRCRQLETFSAEQRVTGHAPYSTHPRLLKAIKKRCREKGQLFSIHTAESEEESEFLANGSGPFVDFLRERGAWDGFFEAPGVSPVAYLDRLGLLDNETLCVHCVQVDEADIVLLARSGAGVCLCPESNRTLKVGKAPVEKMLAAGIAPCLGTDSLASNPHCSLWREMQLLSEEHPGLAPLDILATATLNGAKALGLERQMGAIAPGRQARMLAVEQACSTEEQLLQHLVNVGQEVRVYKVVEVGSKNG